MKTRKQNAFSAPKRIYKVFLVVLFILFLQFCYLSLSPSIYGTNMKEFASNRNTYSSTIYAKRGTVYDSTGNTLAIDVSSYTIVAYLDESRTGTSPTLYHVKDKEKTAKALAPILGASEEYIYNLLNQKLYQTYLGSYGSNISEITKNKIEELQLPGIEFIESYKRYYPNGDFASYLIGYAKKKNTISVQMGKTYDLNQVLKELIGDKKNITWNINDSSVATVSPEGTLEVVGLGKTTVTIYSGGKELDSCVVMAINDEVKTKLDDKLFGELGIEMKYEDILWGSNGYLEFQADKFGYKIPDTKETRKDAQNGSNIYLTIDASIQRILEAAIDKTEEKYSPEWVTLTIMDAKTGDILGSASTPSFNPNDLSTITNYENPLTSFVYEPGSVMKIYTYMCAMEKGTYRGNNTFPSGSIQIGDRTVYDWNRTGWGTITYDFGFQMSSNVGVSYMMQEFLNKEDLKSCLTNYGFGEITNIELLRELSGKIVFNVPVEVAAAAYGQGIFTTPIQQLQALSIVANNGTLIKPNLVQKIVNPNTGSIDYERTIQKRENVVSQSTIDAVKKLMYNTVNDTTNGATGTGYSVKGLEVIGKTGTAEVYNNEAGGYLGEKIYSFAGMFPYDDPQIIIFTSVKNPDNSLGSAIINMTQPVIESVAKYKGLIQGNTSIDNSISKYTLDNVVNQNVETVENNLKEKNLKVVKLGKGDTVIQQYPFAGSSILSTDKIFLLTNDTDIKMPSLKGYSRIEAISVLNLLNIPYEIEGYGVVDSQSLEAGNSIGEGTVKLTLKSKYDFDKKE